MIKIKQLLTTLIFGIFLFAVAILPITAFAQDYEESLSDDLKNAKTIMWIGSHPDDELYTGGMFGHFTRDKSGHLVIVSLYYNPKFVSSNKQSADFLGNADYIRIQEHHQVTNKCHNWNELDSVVEGLKQQGVVNYVKDLINQYKPEIVFGFESTNGYRYSCPHVSFAKIVDEAVNELWQEGNEFHYYYIINRDSVFSSREFLGGYMDPLPVTDTIELDEKLWSYRMKIYEIYSPFYSKLEKIISNEDVQNRLLHKEFFRKLDRTTSIGNASDSYNSKKYCLSQNHPNPFNQLTIINYELRIEEHVSLKVYDMLGNEVAVLVDEYKEAGRHEAIFEVEGLQSGVYYYTIQIGERVENGKLLLIR